MFPALRLVNPADVRLQGLQQDADEITGIMKDNVVRVMEREGKLEDLDRRGEELVDLGKGFEKTARKVERKTRWSNIRLKIIIGVIVAVFLLVVILVLYFLLAPESQHENNPGSERSSNLHAQNSDNITPSGN